MRDSGAAGGGSSGDDPSAWRQLSQIENKLHAARLQWVQAPGIDVNVKPGGGIEKIDTWGLGRGDRDR